MSRDTENVMGELDSPQKASLFVSYYPALSIDRTPRIKTYNKECWLELVSMSEDYYKYQRAYINQVVNLSNPFSSTVGAYTNIENGVGIFAGYHRQMVHFYDF
ncbi:MAG: DUF4249 family protein [Draconibacterium sp.]